MMSVCLVNSLKDPVVRALEGHTIHEHVLDRILEVRHLRTNCLEPPCRVCPRRTLVASAVHKRRKRDCLKPQAICLQDGKCQHSTDGSNAFVQITVPEPVAKRTLIKSSHLIQICFSCCLGSVRACRLLAIASKNKDPMKGRMGPGG